MEKLLELAKKIQSLLRDFYLAGGTAIMFKYNHRESIDLDFFKETPFSFNRLSIKIRKSFNVQSEERFVDNIDFYIEDVKVSFVFFPFKNLLPIEKFKEIKKASDYDIFLNKIYSAGRRVDPKDPFDAAFLYNIYQWDKVKVEEDFTVKFPNQSYKIYLGALLNFEDYGQLPQWVKETLLKLL
ncbi:nucleotidyl transferase AbiEii/AbiGii toxin family protein [Thermodesulfovibrio yellowstonii]|uniref:Nucleotidyl transferase AbiEii/AbiGii toxin family protein n=1 Tax=Thermodesulfovibrio yellowstonii TaxID=28262 RepID=A0A9W6GCX1_9BACT|nr:nucleotidyl transferase AbiEii/AbiGii toxin family protein [Thermodesulfovibrio islandicus]GLI52883.1 hypothetical protein TISLANDTSLP1_05760 [Thermodesulfovibrio islandicus]